MIKLFILLPVLILSLINYQIIAAEDKTCNEIKTSDDLLKCAIKVHPDVVKAELALKQGSQLDAIARQRINPEIDSKVLMGKSSGETNTSTEINLSQTIELGGKRSARIKKAGAEKEILQNELLKAKEEVYLTTSIALHRLIQASSELDQLEDAILIYTKILNVYKNRPALNPEQTVSLNLFQFAAAETELRKTSLTSEIKTLKRQVNYATAGALKNNIKVISSIPNNWPTISDSKMFSGSSFKKANSELKLAKFEVEIAKSNAWPDLKIGPSVEFQRGSSSETQFGINLAIPLPLFNSNEANKAYASEGYLLAEKNLKTTEDVIDLERKIFVDKYNDAVEAISKARRINDFEKKHKNVEKLFMRGLVSSALVIETHRQFLDFFKSLHEQEIVALESLIKISAIDGTLIKE
jgi:cobalt-zinc-cadmium efflux system outer membrane protein